MRKREFRGKLPRGGDKESDVDLEGHVFSRIKAWACYSVQREELRALDRVRVDAYADS